jgi:hypothetical protein
MAPTPIAEARRRLAQDGKPCSVARMAWALLRGSSRSRDRKQPGHGRSGLTALELSRPHRAQPGHLSGLRLVTAAEAGWDPMSAAPGCQGGRGHARLRSAWPQHGAILGHVVRRPGSAWRCRACRQGLDGQAARGVNYVTFAAALLNDNSAIAAGDGFRCMFLPPA